MVIKFIKVKHIDKSSDILKDLEKILKIKIFSYFNEKKIKNNLPLKRLAEDNNLF